MPVIDPGYNQPKTKKTKKRQPSSHPRPVGEPSVGQNKKSYGVVQRREQARRKVAPTRSPVGDRNKNYGIARAEKFKQSSPKYAASVRAAYRKGSLDSRRQQVAVAESRLKGRQGAYRKSLGLKPLSSEDLAILEAHRQRHKYDVEKLHTIGFIPRVRYAKYLDDYNKKQAADKHAKDVAEVNSLTPATRQARLAAGLQPGEKLGNRLNLVKIGLDTPGGVAKRVAATAVATYHDPIGVPYKTAKQTVTAVPAALGGVVQFVREPEKTFKKSIDDFQGRNTETFAKKVKRIRKEGAFNDLADIATVASATGGATSAAARAALLGKLGERAAVRLSGGVVKPRRKAGVVRTYLGGKKDARTAARLEQELQRATTGPKEERVGMDAVRRAAAESNRKAGKVVEVVPSAGKLKRVQNRLVANARGKGVYRLRHDQAGRIETARKTINNLSKEEKRAFYYADVFGIKTPAQAREHLSTLKQNIEQGRAAENLGEIKGTLKKSDMVPDIEKMLADPEKHFTPRLRDVIENLREDSNRAAAEDPRLTPEQVRARRYAPLADLLGMRRGEKAGAPTWEFHPPDHPDATHNGNGTVEGSLAELGPDSEHVLPEQAALPAGDHRYLPALIEPHGSELDHPLPHDAADGSIPHAGYYEERAGSHYDPNETHAEFVDRVAAEAQRRGLADPLYFKSERYVGPADYASRALGGRRAMRADFRYKGGNLKVGLQDTTPEQYLRGLARNIKAKHNWNQVADMADEHRFSELAPPGGSTMRTLRQRVYEAGIDEGSIAYWNPGVFRDVAKRVDAADTDSLAAKGQDLAGLDLSPSRVRSALKEATIEPGEAGVPDHLLETSGWQAVPAEVIRELERQTTPSRAAARAWDAAKGKASRAILLTGNVPWAAYQVASNAVMTTAATGLRSLNPANWVGAAKWWHDLPHEERNRIGAEIGLDTSGSQYANTHLGAATNSHMVNTYRAFKAHPFFHTGVLGGRGPSLSQLNPAEAMANFDRSQNNVARIITTYTGLKKDAARQMSGHILNTQAAQDRLMAALGKGDINEQINALAQDPHILEQHAENVRDWLGDYTSLTSAERHGFNRAIMFYPYMRYSLKLVFYTLPMKHPVVASVLAELGQLHEQDLKKLLGGNNLYWDLGKVYFGDKGDVKEIDLRRANPALNALFDAAGMKNPKQLIGLLPPWAGWAANQAFQEDTFAGRDWRVHGKAAPYGGANVPYDVGADPTRARILLDDMLGIFYPYREMKAEKFNPSQMAYDPALEGTQGDDSLPWSPRPVTFKGRTYVSKLQKAEAKKSQAFDKQNRSILGDLVPFIPQPSRDLESAKARAAIDRAQQAGAPKDTTKYFKGDGLPSVTPRKKKSKPFGAK